MALISPGLQLSVTDESQYVPGAVGSVPLVILATAQDKTNPAGATALGTTKANAGKLQAYASQRELVSAFGYPSFQQSSAGTALHGDERNEYGLMAAYSALGIGNRVYAIRADIDLAQLEATSNRPTGTVADGTYWLDLLDSNWGINEWDASAGVFNAVTPAVITDSAQYSNVGGINTPLASVGEIGSYAVVLNPAGSGGFSSSVWYTFKKLTTNAWAVLGSRTWQADHATIRGTTSSPVIASASPAAAITINGTSVTVGSTSVTKSLADVVTAINAATITGVTARAVNNKLEILATDLALNDAVVIADSAQTPLATLGIAAGTYNAPTSTYGSYVAIPAWRSTDTTPRPSGSVFFKTSAIGGGADIVIKKYSAGTGTWTAQAAPLYNHPTNAIFNLDPTAGGFNIAAGTLYVRYDVTDGTVGDFKPYYRRVAGATKITSNAAASINPFTSGNAFTITVTSIGTSALTTYSISLSSTGLANFAAAIQAANIPELTVSADTTAKTITLTHKYGGDIKLTNVTGTPVADAGFDTTIAGVQANATGALELTNWSPLAYTYSVNEPTQDPVDGTLWYYGSATDVDVMINTTTGWMGYQNETNDARGYNLSLTDDNGVIVSASKPTTQVSGSALAAGDLWLDTSDLENWPALYRFSSTTWVKIDNTDQVGQNGIIFADARWGTAGTVDPVSGSLPTITDLLTSDYLDLDAPDYRLYPRGTLLFNTRRSGYNVKRFVSNYFSEANFPDDSLPTVANAWVSASGLKDNGSMYAGHQAQRHMVVSALKAALDGNTAVREDQYAFNLIAAPGYQELIANMVALNNDRQNTAFIIGDTPFRLAPNTIDLINWSNNTDNATGLTTNDPYLGVYYPGAAQTNDVQGNTIVVPASHVALRTFLHSDNISYQWFAPAGTRRGLVDNANSVGYIDAMTGEYNPIGVNQGLRDSLYENKINPITNLPGIGLVVWGQKTRNPVASAMDRVNVARLVNYIRTILASVGNGFLFEPNDKITRDQLKTIISGAVNDLVSKRGVYDYLVVCDDSNNTPTRIARNELYVDIAIEPMKDVEFIYIPIRLYNPGGIKQLGA
jgi:hypothetical protein